MSTHDLGAEPTEQDEEGTAVPEVRRKIMQTLTGEGTLTVEALAMLCTTLPQEAVIIDVAVKAVRTKPEWRLAVEHEVAA